MLNLPRYNCYKKQHSIKKTENNKNESYYRSSDFITLCFASYKWYLIFNVMFFFIYIDNVYALYIFMLYIL